MLVSSGEIFSPRVKERPTEFFKKTFWKRWKLLRRLYQVTYLFWVKTGVIILICFLDITTSIFMESPGALVSTERETDLDKSACAGLLLFLLFSYAGGRLCRCPSDSSHQVISSQRFRLGQREPIEIPELLEQFGSHCGYCSLLEDGSQYSFHIVTDHPQNLTWLEAPGLLPQASKCSLGSHSLPPPSLVGQVILKHKSINVASTTCHLNGLALSSIPSFWTSPHFFLAYRPLHTLLGPHRTFYRPIVPICRLIYARFCTST